MKDIYKNPILYYIVVPVVASLWPLFVGAGYLPSAEDNLQAEKAQWIKAQNIIDEILVLAPNRLKLTDPKTADAEFDYANAVDRIARLCKIPPTSYKLSSGKIITTGGRKSRSAKVVLKDVDITKFAKFLSTIQLRWANLQCTKVKLVKKKGLPDKWDIDLDFKYYYYTE